MDDVTPNGTLESYTFSWNSYKLSGIPTTYSYKMCRNCLKFVIFLQFQLDILKIGVQDFSKRNFSTHIPTRFTLIPTRFTLFPTLFTNQQIHNNNTNSQIHNNNMHYHSYRVPNTFSTDFQNLKKLAQQKILHNILKILHNLLKFLHNF